MKRFFHIAWACCLCLHSSPAGQPAGKQPDNLSAFIRELGRQMPRTAGSGYQEPTEADLRTWSRIFTLFRKGEYDSCRTLLAGYHYGLLQLRDNVTGAVYDVFKEDYPVRRGWGTFFYNRGHAKRLYVHVNHPVDDAGVLQIGADLFRRSGAEWFLVGGTGKRAGYPAYSADIARSHRSVFQRWHELLTDLTHVTISLHAYQRSSYEGPISSADIIMSNGKTSDEQWGISQLSLSVRDTLRTAGLGCSLAMYDSGFAPLAAAGNPQALFSNDSVGFGHWFNIELSDAVRDDPARARAFIAATERGLELTGKKVSRQMNRAFGLVSPRVVRIDSMHGMMFPPPGSETYRIVALAAGAGTGDTIDLRMGNWFGLPGSGRTVSSITRIDTARGSALRRLRLDDLHATIATLGELPGRSAGRALHSDTLAGDEADRLTNEPLQVHRIPLHPLTATQVAVPIGEAATPFEWKGVIAPDFASRTPVFTVTGGEETATLANYLIPLLSNSYHNGRNSFIGIRMTSLLVKEITRLVAEHKEASTSIGLLAEQTESGDYYLRLFPENASAPVAGLLP